MDVSSVAVEATLEAAHASVWAGTRWFMYIMEYVHDSMGLPWFEAIVVSNLVVKAVSLPLPFIMQKKAPMMAAMRQDAQLVSELMKKREQAKSAAEYAEVSQRLQVAMQDHGEKYKGKKRWAFIQPVMAVAQMMLFISQFSAISTLSSCKVPSMTYEGAAWFTDLTAPDPYMLLPIVCCATTLLQVNSRRFQDAMLQAGPTAAGIKPIMTLASGLILVAGYFQPSAIALLWASNSILGIGQSALLNSPRVRALCGLPPMPAPGPAPGASLGYKQLWADMVKKATSKGDKQQAPAKAAAAAGAPPPGVGPAVNYVPHRPRVRARGKRV